MRHLRNLWLPPGEKEPWVAGLRDRTAVRLRGDIIAGCEAAAQLSQVALAAAG